MTGVMPDGFRGRGYACWVALCLQPECAAIDVVYDGRITAVYRTIRERGWSHWSRARARFGWRCALHAGYQPEEDFERWQVDDMRCKGRVQAAHVVFCGEPACPATWLAYESSAWWSVKRVRQAGWACTRFGWRCPEHKRWWTRLVDRAIA